MSRYKFGISGPWWYASGATIQSEQHGPPLHLAVQIRCGSEPTSVPIFWIEAMRADV